MGLRLMKTRYLLRYLKSLWESCESVTHCAKQSPEEHDQTGVADAGPGDTQRTGNNRSAHEDDLTKHYWGNGWRGIVGNVVWKQNNQKR